jgi:hypothetical protein
MAKNVLVYYIGIIGIPGKGPIWIEPYQPNKTIGELIQTLKNNGFGESNKRIEIFKWVKGDLNKYDTLHPYWAHTAKMSDYLNLMGLDGNDIALIYCIV